MIKRIAALTMARNDDFYLSKWVEYYGAQLGKDNLYVFLDGKDQKAGAFCEGTNVEAVEKIGGNVVASDKARIRFLSDAAARLFKDYDIVIGTDADEYLVVDPALGMSLAEFLSNADIHDSLSGLGVDVGQFLGRDGDERAAETDIDGSRPFLSQRSYGLLGTRYTKASVLARPLAWGCGFHRVKRHNFHIAPGLFLFHCGYFDMARIRARFADKDRLASGWRKHLEKRSSTIRAVTALPARDWDRWTRLARIVQTVVRPPYAWNKPAMFNLKIVVHIPERFRQVF